MASAKHVQVAPACAWADLSDDETSSTISPLGLSTVFGSDSDEPVIPSDTESSSARGRSLGPSEGRTSWSRTPSPEGRYTYVPSSTVTPPEGSLTCGDCSTNELPSRGSLGHPLACALPCKFAMKKKGCKDGEDCDRCHLCRFRHHIDSQRRPQRRPRGHKSGSFAGQ